MVERHAGRRIGHHRPGPAGTRPMADLGEAAFDVAGGNQDDAAEPLGKGAAIIRHPAVVGAVHRRLEGDVVARGPGAEPARRQGQVHVDPFAIHVGDSLGGVVVDPRRRPRPVGAGESGHIAGRRRLGGGIAEAALVAAPTLVIGDPAGTRIDVSPFRPIGQPRFLGRRQVSVENVHRRSDMRVGVENPEAVARHVRASWCCYRREIASSLRSSLRRHCKRSEAISVRCRGTLPEPRRKNSALRAGAAFPAPSSSGPGSGRG